jgi:hypothetical protein
MESICSITMTGSTPPAPAIRTRSPSFLPETADELITVGREPLAAGRKARQRRSTWTDYVESVEPR